MSVGFVWYADTRASRIVSAEAVPASNAAATVAMTVLRITAEETPESACECARALESGQRRSCRVGNGNTPEGTGHLATNHQASDSSIDHSGAKASTVGQLVDQLIGNMFDRAVDQDQVVRRTGFGALAQRTFDDVDSIRTRCR